MYTVLNPDGIGPLGRPWSRWEDNFKIDPKHVG
jgi:hypothetical protein